MKRFCKKIFYIPLRIQKLYQICHDLVENAETHSSMYNKSIKKVKFSTANWRALKC